MCSCVSGRVLAPVYPCAACVCTFMRVPAGVCICVCVAVYVCACAHLCTGHNIYAFVGMAMRVCMSVYAHTFLDLETLISARGPDSWHSETLKTVGSFAPPSIARVSSLLRFLLIPDICVPQGCSPMSLYRSCPDRSQGGAGCTGSTFPRPIHSS